MENLNAKLWIYNDDIPEHLIQQAFTDLKDSGINGVVIQLDLSEDKNHSKRKVPPIISKYIYHSRRCQITPILCFSHEKYKNTNTKYIIPQNSSALCNWMKEYYKYFEGNIDVFEAMEQYLNQNRNEYLIGLGFIEYDELVNKLSPISSTSAPNIVIFDNSTNTEAKKITLLSKYDFIVIRDNITSYTFRKELKELYQICKSTQKPIIEAPHTFSYGSFIGKDNIPFMCGHIANAENYIYVDSFDIIKNTVCYKNLSKEIKKNL